MAAEKPEAIPFELEAGGLTLEGEAVGEGHPVVLLHGVTATRRYVLHGSVALPRRGFRAISYDARGHGDSGAAPAGEGYGYEALAADLAAVIERHCASPPLVAGHSMGCHTAAAHALAHADEIAGLVLIGPASLGVPPPPESLAHWDRLADGLESDGVEGFTRAYEADLAIEGEWRERLLRITLDRIRRHRHPTALAQAIRDVARSLPFEGLAELESLDLPALVVASRDESDPEHPLAVAESWAQALPRAELVVEPPGKPPLAWQGGRLSREIASFAERPEIAERLAGGS